MQHDGQRMLLAAETANEIIRHSRTRSRQYSNDKIEWRYSIVEPLDQEHAAKRDGIKQPLNRHHAFLQDEDRDRCGKDRREILNSLCRRQRHLLQRQKKEKQSCRAKYPAEQQMPLASAQTIQYLS